MNVPTNLPLQPLVGVIERITFYNEENGYTVARFVPEGKSYTVTVIGNMMGASVGESLSLQGIWTNHPAHGRQFEIKKFTIQLPATVEGIRKYLGSGLTKGVGPVTAKRIVDFFGVDTLEVIEKEIDRLYEVGRMKEDDPARIEAGVEYVLAKFMDGLPRLKKGMTICHEQIFLIRFAEFVMEMWQVEIIHQSRKKYVRS